MLRYRKLEIGETDVERLSDEELVLLLLEAGASRLTAQRIVEVERGRVEAGRARRHTRAR
jgi:hypothetical protein